MDALTCLRNYSDSDSSVEDSKEKAPARSRNKSSNKSTMDRDQKRSRSRSPNRRERNDSSRRREKRSRSPRSSSERHSHSDHRHHDRHHHKSSSEGSSHNRRDRDTHHSSRRSETKSEEQSSRHKHSPQPPAKDGDGASASATSYTNDPDLTPEQKLEKALAARQATAPKLPGYMNPGAANPSKLIATHEKRKMLWSKNKKERSWNNWESASFDDGGQGDKFRKLMGIKATPSSSSSAGDDSKQQQKNAKLLQDLEVQYETSRFMTHKARGVGLGYGMSTQTLEPKIDQSTDNLLETSDRRQ